MKQDFYVLAINGSASPLSSNLGILCNLKEQINSAAVNYEIIDDLSIFPHFRTNLTEENTPESIINFRKKVSVCDAVIISTPEYVFSIPSGLKNILEWCVSTTVFQEKPLVIITAAANGQKAHDEIQLIMKTIESDFNEKSTLLVSGIKGKIKPSGEVLNEELKLKLKNIGSNLMTKLTS